MIIDQLYKLPGRPRLPPGVTSLLKLELNYREAADFVNRNGPEVVSLCGERERQLLRDILQRKEMKN
jgi:hypothetical protein